VTGRWLRPGRNRTAVAELTARVDRLDHRIDALFAVMGEACDAAGMGVPDACQAAGEAIKARHLLAGHEARLNAQDAAWTAWRAVNAGSAARRPGRPALQVLDGGRS